MTHIFQTYSTTDTIGCIEHSDLPLTRRVIIINKKGLHARATAKFVLCASKFNAKILVTHLNETVGGTSIMGILTLCAVQNSEITLSATGPDAGEALDALGDLIAHGFGEED